MDKLTFARRSFQEFNRELTDKQIGQLELLQRALIDSEAFEVLADPKFRSVAKGAFGWYTGSQSFTTWRAAIIAVLMDYDVDALVLRFRSERIDQDEGPVRSKHRGCHCATRGQRRQWGRLRRDRRALSAA